MSLLKLSFLICEMETTQYLLLSGCVQMQGDFQSSALLLLFSC